MSGWLNITDGVSHLLVWRYSIVEHYTLERWNAFLRSSFPLAKGYSCGYRLFALDDAMAEWPERRKALELEAMREALSRPTNAEVRVFVKDAEELRREKYAAQQAGKAAKAPAAKADEPATKVEVPGVLSRVLAASHSCFFFPRPLKKGRCACRAKEKSRGARHDQPRGPARGCCRGRRAAPRWRHALCGAH